LAGGYSVPDVLAYLQNETELTRSTLVRILKESGRLGDFFTSVVSMRWIYRAASVWLSASPVGSLEAIRKHMPPQGNDDSEILLVDDDPRTLEMLEESLRSAGYETQSVQSGARALEVLSSKLVSAVLLDLLMPGMDGFEVIRHVRQEATLKELPIFVMTGKSLTPEESALLARDTQALLQKNGSWQQQLIAEVGRVVQDRKRAKSAGQS